MLMKKIIAITLLASLIFVGCGTEDNLCQFEGYDIIDYVVEDSSCNCGKSYYLHLKNGHKFEQVNVNVAVFNYYKKQRPTSGYYRIECVEEVELKEGG